MQTSYRARRKKRPKLDRSARRYFVYWLFDEHGTCLYIGRSCQVRERLKVHMADAAWFAAARRVEMDGPFTWDEAVHAEAKAIRLAQPPNNIMHTDRWPEVLTRAKD